MYLGNGAVLAPFFPVDIGISHSFFLEDLFSFLIMPLSLFSNYMNVTPSSYSTVNHQLRELTHSYLAKHPGLTVNALAQRSGIAATTLRRLMQEENRSELAPHSVLALVSYILKEKRISFLLNKVEGPVGDLLKKSFDQFIFNEQNVNHEISADLNLALQDKTCYLIYKLAANACGTTIEEIKNIFGLSGLNTLNSLIEKKWIIADQNEVLHAKDKNFSLDLVLAHQHTHALLDFYKPLDIDKGHNLFYSLSEGMSASGIKKIKEVEKDAVKKIFEIMNDKDLQGPLPYFAVVLSDILGISPQSLEGVIQ
jgi:hypothetical protein